MVNVDKWTEEFQKWGICYFVLTFCTNLYSTRKPSCFLGTLALLTPDYLVLSLLAVAIAWWCVSNGRRLTRRLRNHIVIPVFLVVVESGAIYSMGMFATIIARAASSNSMFTVLEFMPSLIVRASCLCYMSETRTEPSVFGLHRASVICSSFCN